MITKFETANERGRWQKEKRKVSVENILVSINGKFYTKSIKSECNQRVLKTLTLYMHSDKIKSMKSKYT